MAKVYWVAPYRAVNSPEKLAAYAELAGPAIIAGGGKIIVRGTPVKTYEAGLIQHRCHRIRESGPSQRDARFCSLSGRPCRARGWCRTRHQAG
jgi:uncharacterized protein (DUF1330 family)